MRNLFANRCFNLDAGQAVSGIARESRTVRVVSGRVWLTVEGQQDDFWLSAGDSVAVAPGRLVVIEADRTASRIDLAPARQGAGTGFGAQWQHLTQRWTSAAEPCSSC
ncbi:hypothetical protein AAKU55_003808 [Oxalobacteraceae bacterium GrIS 1.11]